MASPCRVFRIYAQLAADAPVIAEFLAAKGDKIPGTVSLLLKRDPLKLLARWQEEMHELCGVLDGSHEDSYLMEATQTWYWGSLFSVVQGATWEDLAFAEAARQVPSCGIATVVELRAAVDRLAAQGAAAKPAKLALLWQVADAIYRRQTPAAEQWTVEQMMEADFQEMKKRPYLEPILRQVAEC